MSYVGRFVLQNQNKYIGIGRNPIYKSALEARAFSWLDTNNKVKRWGYEIIRIPYFLPFDSKLHKYHVDIYAEIVNNQNTIVKFIAEIKSTGDFKTPGPLKVNSRKSRRNHRLATLTYIKNQCKWKAAKQYAAQSGMRFIFLTEKDLM